MPQNAPSEESIFALALEKPMLAERAAFLEGACVGDPALCARIEGLIKSHEGAGSFLHQPHSIAGGTLEYRPILEAPGQMIGPYKLLQRIGEGGMGAVYLAEQEQPVRRKVALKIIKPGMDSSQVVARFEAERQALALMEHQNIARVLDAGTTDSGRPYFVMELVKGIPITEYCDANRLSPRERLELFVPVCRAIQHAHQKGIIHRDIKPSNVLVSLYDGVPVPKVIDFGVAKATDQRLTERTMFTQHGAVLGTLEYMSPEQAENSALDIDTRSDIYSLGILLYELLTGSTPLERATLRAAGYVEILKRIKEEEPPRPSTRLSASRATLASISAQRQTEPSKLAGLVRGELDWIVMKALEKDRTRRYETAVGFARDVERHLRDETVEACPPSAGYRLRKLASKHRTAMVTATSFAVLLFLGAILSTGLAIRARQAEDRAIDEAARVRQAEKQTRSERDKAVAAERAAVVAQRNAVAKREEAEAARQSLRRSLYVSDMQIAHTAWSSGDVVRMKEVLDGQRPGTGETDLRGFEWNYLQRLGSSVKVTRLAPGARFAGALSLDGAHYVYVRTIVEPLAPRATSAPELRLLAVTPGREPRGLIPFPGEAVNQYSYEPTFSPDGKRFAFKAIVIDAADRARWRIKVFDWATGRDVGTIANLASYPHTIVFDASDGRLAVLTRTTGDAAGSDLRIWEVAGGKELLMIPLPGRQTAPPQSLAFSPDGTCLAALTTPAGSEASAKPVGEVRLWDAGSGEERLRFETRPSSSGVMYSPDGKQLVEIGAGGSHTLRDANSGKVILELTSTPTDVRSWGGVRTWMLAFSPDGSRLASSSGGDRVQIWDVTSRGASGSRLPERILEAKRPTPALSHVAWSADGRFISAAGSGGTVTTWPLALPKGRVVVKGTGQTEAVTATVAAAGSRFAAAFEDPDRKTVLKVWDETGSVLFETTEDTIPAHGHSQTKVTLSRDGTRLAFTSSTSNNAGRKKVCRLCVWDVTEGREVFRRPEEKGELVDAALSPDGRLLAASWGVLYGTSAERKQRIALWDLETGQERFDLSVPEPCPITLAFSPDGRRLAGGLSSPLNQDVTGELRVWDAANGQRLLTQKLTDGSVGSLAYNGDGTLLAVGLGNWADAGVIDVFEAASGQKRFSLAGHRFMVEQFAFSPDGRRLASLASSLTEAAEVKLWDLAGGRETLTLETNEVDRTGNFHHQPSGLGFSPDGHRLCYVPGGQRRDAEVLVWDATPLPEEGHQWRSHYPEASAPVTLERPGALSRRPIPWRSGAPVEKE